MIKMAMSQAASGLLRALIGRARVPRDRILLTEVHTIDWRSLTFTGERHPIQLRVPGPNSTEVVERMCCALEDAEFSIPGHIVADIAVLGAPKWSLDGSTSLTIEALTIVSD
jgi:hypothetical protein